MKNNPNTPAIIRARKIFKKNNLVKPEILLEGILYSKLSKLLNNKKFSEIEKICKNEKIIIDKDDNLLTIYGVALINQNKYKLALEQFRKSYSISTKVRNIENLAYALHKTKNFKEASDLYMKLSTFWKNAKIKNHTKIEKNEGFLIF